jgi:hypothetical protein
MLIVVTSGAGGGGGAGAGAGSAGVGVGGTGGAGASSNGRTLELVEPVTDEGDEGETASQLQAVTAHTTASAGPSSDFAMPDA